MSNSPVPSSRPVYRLVIHFTHLRPYHLARIRSAEDAYAHSGTSVHGLALIDSTGPLPPELPISRPSTPPLILFPECSSLPASSRRISREVFRVLDQLRPTAIAICGYATPDARACLRWCRRHGAKAILMTETRECDGSRVWWKEWIKSRIVRRFDSALCGGPESRAYLEKLGMPADRIAEGYDVVDNDYFARESDRIRAEEGDREQETGDRGQETDSSSQLSAFQFSAFTPKYFLASNRFIPRKNVSGLIEAYASYIQKSKIGNHQSSIVNPSPPWNLCLLGDGELKPSLIAQCHRLGLQVIEKAPWEVPSSQSEINNQLSSIVNQPSASSLTTDTCPLTPGIVFFPGWRPHAELPRFYAHAGAFVHPAITEPWGLVVNEAMASGLPVLLSPGTGAAATLLVSGLTGESIDVQSLENFSNSLKTFAGNHTTAARNTTQAARAVLAERSPTSGFGSALVKLSRV
jgi:glycosyltransferase involved in cell wall biosynthesis